MAFKRLFSYADVDIPNRSSHDEFHRHAFTLLPGTLVPSFSDFLVPGDIVDVSPKFSVQMAPQATDFIGRINLRTELFFVPFRTIWAGWKDFVSYPSEGIGGPAPTDPNYHAKFIPGAIIQDSAPLSVKQFQVTSGSNSLEGVQSFLTSFEQKITDANNGDLTALFTLSNTNSTSANVGPGSLCDYLGFKVNYDKFDPSYLSSVIEKFLEPFDATKVYPITSGDSSPYVAVTINNDGTYNYKKISSLDTSYYSTNKIDVVFIAYVSRQYYRAWLYPFSTNYSSLLNLQINNILPFVCYHKVYDDWYRDARIQKPLFPSALGDSPAQFASSIPYITKFGAGFNKKLYQGDGLKFYDGKSLFDLRQRLWQKDFFTTMTQQPQSGDPMSVTFDTSGDTGEFTIASLRVANSMQLWRERNNLVSPRYGDIMYAQYGEYPDDAVTDRAIYLGSNTVEIYNKSVYQSAEYQGNSNNPFNSIGTKYANPMGVGQGSLVQNYKVKEHGLLLALTSIVPEAAYSSGTRRMFSYDQIDDIAFPLLQNVGDQPVYAREIIDIFNGQGDDSVIGYTGRYNEYKFINDHISGLLRDGQSLASFALQRSFSEAPTIGTEFLEIPTTYLDQVSAVGTENSKFGAWIESAWSYNKSSKFSQNNAIPTLGRMEDVHKISVPKGGTRL